MKPFFTPERRICMVRCFEPERTERRAFFHLFTTKATPVMRRSPMVDGYHGAMVSKPVAIVEYEDGTVHMVEPSLIRFLDTKGLMEQYAWVEEPKIPDTPFKCPVCGIRSVLPIPNGCPKCAEDFAKEEPQVRDCTTCEYNENGVNRPCHDCKNFDKWEEQKK